MLVDLAGIFDHGCITAGDFEFKVGNANDPSMYLDAPSPSSVRVAAGQGAGGSDRVTIEWPDGAIRDTWLQVTVKATVNTGLSHPDVFYFGNAVGESGDSDSHALVNAFDFAGPRDNHRAAPDADIANRFDYNRDRLIDGADMAVARDAADTFLTALRLITAPIVIDSFTGQAPEFSLTGDADVVGPYLQVTPSENSQQGSAWYNRQAYLAGGFTSEFSFSFDNATGGGADGMTFTVHNDPAGLSLWTSETGPGSNALTIGLDSFFNGSPEPSRSSLFVRSGPNEFLYHDLLGDGIDLSDGNLYHVRVVYMPGDLDVYFDGQRLFESLNVDLGTIGAIDGSGRSYVGFSARTGGSAEEHNVHRWTLFAGGG